MGSNKRKMEHKTSMGKDPKAVVSFIIEVAVENTKRKLSINFVGASSLNTQADDLRSSARLTMKFQLHSC